MCCLPIADCPVDDPLLVEPLPDLWELRIPSSEYFHESLLKVPNNHVCDLRRSARIFGVFFC